MYRDAFNETIGHFNLSARDIASKAGLHESAVSNFRSGRKDITVGTLERLLAALPEDAREYIYLKALVGSISNRGISVLLGAISNRMMQESQAEAVNREDQSTVKLELSMLVSRYHG